MHYHRNEREEFVAYLATKFPKCFFEDASLRRPLKHNIVVDLEKENVLDPEKLSQALDWYTEDFAYRYNLLPGTERVDLDGRKAGTVTLEEHKAARAWVTARKRELAERRALAPKPAAVVVKANGPMNGADYVTKASAPPSLHPSLAEMQSSIAIVNGILTDQQYELLRPVLATAALREIIARAEKLMREVSPT